MTSEPTTRLQVSGYRFVLRRIESALLGRDPGTADRGARGRSLAAGGLAAIVVAAGCAIFASAQSPAVPGDAPIVMGAESGALYVRLGDTLHPVLNLASARLIAATDANPARARESDIGRAKRGPLLGIPDAPRTLPPPLGPDESVWTVCDAGAVPTTTVIGSAPEPRLAPTGLGPEQTMLVTADAATAYLLYGGQRAVVSLADPAVVRALHLDGLTPRPVSRRLLNAVPEAPPIAAPTVAAAGRRGPATLPGVPAGTLIRVPRLGAAEYYVVLADGIQPVGQVAAELLRLTDSHGRREILSVSPDAIRAVPTVDRLPVSTFPDRSAPVRDGPATLCVSWGQPSDGGDETVVSAGAALPLPPGREPVALAQADAGGPALDAVSLPPARSGYVQTTDGRYLIAETGVRFAIRDDGAARSLGLPTTAAPAPWPMIAGLPQGPELSRDNALVARDVVRAGRSS